MTRKPQPRKKIRPPPTPAPLLSPKIWMNPEFDPYSISVLQLRAILDFNQVTDPYHRKYQQVDLFLRKVLPRIETVIARHKGDIYSKEDSDLLKELEMIQKKRRTSHLPDAKPENLNDHSQVDREPPLKRLKTTSTRYSNLIRS